MARLPRRVLNARIFEKRIFYSSDSFIIYYDNTKYLEIHLGFTKTFSIIVNIQTVT